MDKFRWYDWIVIFMTADLASAVLLAVMMGAIEIVFVLPLIVMSWLSYEQFRIRIENDQEPE